MANIYVIGSLGRNEKIKKTANYYKSLGNYEIVFANRVGTKVTILNEHENE